MRQDGEVRVLGVDGCRGAGGNAWIGALLTGRRVEWLALPTSADVVAVGADAIGVDIPIGLPTAGYRGCDLAARVRLGPARSSVFHAPVRAVLAATSYAEACALSYAAHGKKISQQTWHIVPRIRSMDAVRLPEHLVEVHPEVSFRALDPRVRDRKKSPAGRAQRLAALSAVADVELPRLPGVAADDALDALAAAWSARRWLAGESETLPAGPVPRDERGRPMRIVV